MAASTFPTTRSDSQVTTRRPKRLTLRCCRSTLWEDTSPSTWSLSRRRTTRGLSAAAHQHVVDFSRFKKQFATYLASDISSADLEELYTSAYASIREDPAFKPTDKDSEKWKSESLKRKVPKLNREQRRRRVEEKISAYKSGKVDAVAEADEEEAEEDDDEE